MLALYTYISSPLYSVHKKKILVWETYLCWKLCSRWGKTAGRTERTKDLLGPRYQPPDWDGEENNVIWKAEKNKFNYIKKQLYNMHPFMNESILYFRSLHHILFKGLLTETGNISHYQPLVCVLCTVCGYSMAGILGLPALIHTAGLSQQSACLPPPRSPPVLDLHD